MNTDPKQNPLFSLEGDYAARILSYYLWGTETPPTKEAITNSAYASRKANEPITVDIDIAEYFKVTHMENFDAHEFAIVQKFFSKKFTNGANILNHSQKFNEITKEYKLSYSDILNIIYPQKEIERLRLQEYAPAMDYFFYSADPNSANFAKNAFVFGSTKLTFDTEKIQFVFDENGEPLRIDNFRIQPANESYNATTQKLNPPDNFDFDGGTGVANNVNHLLRQIADPSDIGNKVNFHYADLSGNADKFYRTITKPETHKSVFIEALKSATSIDDVYNLASEIGDAASKPVEWTLRARKYLDELHSLQKSGVINYLDKDGKLVIFDANNTNSINGTEAYNLDLSKSIDYMDFESSIKKHEAEIDKIIKESKDSVLSKDDYTRIKDISIYLAALKSFEWLGEQLNKNVFSLNHYKNKIQNGITYIGGIGEDTIIGTDYNDTIFGYAPETPNANDDKATNTLYGGLGEDTLYGGAGNDSLIAGVSLEDTKDTATNTVFGGLGSDNIFGSAGDDYLYAGNGVMDENDKSGNTIYGGLGGDNTMVSWCVI